MVVPPAPGLRLVAARAKFETVDVTKVSHLNYPFSQGSRRSRRFTFEDAGATGRASRISESGDWDVHLVRGRAIAHRKGPGGHISGTSARWWLR